MSRPPLGRRPAVRLRSGRRRTASSRRWLERQLTDPYVAAAREKGWRSRAAFKLIEIDDRFALLGAGRRVVDLGAAPGGWSQVAVARGARPVIAVDRQEMASLAGAETVVGDIREDETVARVRAALGGAADLVLSDMAAPATGHAATDHIRVAALAEAAFVFALSVLAPGGALVCKVLGSGADGALLAEMKRRFGRVRHVKPPASRADSAERYLVATGFRPAA